MSRIMLLLFLLAPLASASTLEGKLHALTPGQWLDYSVPLQPGQAAPCCSHHRDGNASVPDCRLDAPHWNISSREDAPSPPEARLRVLLRRSADGFDRLRAIGAECPLVRGDEILIDAGAVDAEASVALLRQGMARSQPSEHGHALAAIAHHAGAGADAALVAAAAPESPLSQRRDAVFWLSRARGDAGLMRVLDMVDSPRDVRTDLRRHQVFAVSVSPMPGALPALRRLARTHESALVRGEAIFWLAQRHDEQVEAIVAGMLQHETATTTRERAVFALSQLPPERAIRALRDLIESSPSREVRRRALFWLAQVDDDGVLTVFDALLGRAEGG